MADTSYEVDAYESSGMGWKLFAGIMVMIVGTFNVIDGLVAITNAEQFDNALVQQRVAGDEQHQDVGLGRADPGPVLILSGFLIFIGNMSAG